MKQDIQLEAYASEFVLKQPFQSASSEVKRKTELVIAGRDPATGDLIYAMEMPLSPSSGESVQNVLNALKNVSAPPSPSVLRFISYLNGLCHKGSWASLSNLKSRSERNAIDLATFDTKSILHVPPDFNGIAKLKGSPNNIPTLIRAINKYSCSFIVDFNGSLTCNQYENFAQSVDIDNIIGVEQPTQQFAEGVNFDLPLIADSFLTTHGYSKIVAAGYKGFVFKPFLNGFDALKICIENPDGLWGIVGTNISGPIDISLVRWINDFMPIKLTKSNASFYKDHPLNDVNEPLHIMTDEGLIMSPLVDAYLKEYAALRATRVFEGCVNDT
ncbi:hypothetical protein [uncultured Roseibium sp.]|uniref:hypothetical protein n=1 Tax=uncultured Roseibium sp. TaxID=1936171 RepID=UPI0026017B0C|nr:hypothetical protein [uncultured Roseibium sp.]